MTTLLADVGGTNTRLALGQGGQLDPGSVRWFRNDDHTDFRSILTEYDARARALCIAIAGPVTARIARLTNRDWTFDADGFGVPTRLVNDLQAVGHALDVLPATALRPIIKGVAAPDSPRLVIGLGTGFNVSLVAGAEVLRAELGHATLPTAVADWLIPKLGKMPFASVERLFSGKGLTQVHTIRTGTLLPTRDITDHAPQTVDVFAQALGVLTSQLVYHYLPLGGIVFNGGLARAILQSQAGQDGFAAGYRLDRALVPDAIPVQVITDDAAALYGCAALST